MGPDGFVDIPDDIFEAALAASKCESDGEDPYGPQPKRFMQTEDQKEQHKRDLEVRKVAWTIRKIKKTSERTISKRTSSFTKLPSELVLKLMQHTNLQDLGDLINSSAINRRLFRHNRKAIFRGIEIEQFPEWKWLFGDSKHRTPAQSQHLKDAIFSENYFPASGALFWTNDEQLVNVLRMVDDNKFTGMRNVKFLQKMQNFLDKDINTLESHTKLKLARRTMIFLRSLSFHRPVVVNEEDRTEDNSIVTMDVLSWEARFELFNEQPASIQAEIRSVLKIVIEGLYERLEHMVMRWERWYYIDPSNRGAPQELKKWISKLLTGLILELVTPRWHSENRASSHFAHFEWWFRESFRVMAGEVANSLNRYGMGIVDVIEKVWEGVEFGGMIGVDVEGVLEGTLAGDFLTVSV